MKKNKPVSESHERHSVAQKMEVMTHTDWMPDVEFHKLFKRISKFIDFQGAATPREVNRRLQIADGNERALEKLVEHGFGRRTIKDVRVYPKGYTSLVIQYGTQDALQIIRERKRRQIRGWSA